MEGPLIARVYVDKVVYHIDRLFDYVIPPEMAGQLRRGCRVLVPFGLANKKQQALVADIDPLSKRPDALEIKSRKGYLKEIAYQIDPEPIFGEEQFSLAEFLVANTFCTHYDAVRCILPIGENVTVIEKFILSPEASTPQINCLPSPKREVATFLLKKKSGATAKELQAFLGVTQPPQRIATVREMLASGIIKIIEKSSASAAEKTVKMVRLKEGVDTSGIRMTPKQAEIVSLLQTLPGAMLKEAVYLSGVSEAVIKNLVKNGLLEFYECRSLEEPIKGEAPRTVVSPEPISLSPEQNRVFEGITALIKEDSPNAALLHGITGSGKTQIYIKLIEETLGHKGSDGRGKNAMLLVPEIALTPQLLAKFEGYFPGETAVIHSGLSAAERLLAYKRIKAEQVRIVIGTRSAVFSPLKRIGIIIMDEEGESSYKSDTAPRYHARDIAKLRCVEHSATLLLGSATPCVDSYYRAKKSKYSLFTLSERYAGAILPQVFIVDMLAEQNQQNFSSLSEILQEQLAINLRQGEQSILLINRRGYNTFATCMTCGEVVKCNSCDVAMTYHKANDRLMCHYCGRSEKFSTICPSCGGKYLKLTGAGTQKLEDEIGKWLPEARLLRMDTDTTYSRYSYEKAFKEFRDGKYDIMVGTQMIAKGLDFPNVTLVGVINADSGLYSTDYKAGERVFSLVTQVVGRSGRAGKKGRAYIQTLDPQSSVLNFAAQQDYEGFYNDEIHVRKQLRLPPFCDIVTLGFSGENEVAVENAANNAAMLLQEEAMKRTGLTLKVLGVTKATVYRVNNKYRYRLLIKCYMNSSMRTLISVVLTRCGADKRFAKTSTFVDINGEIL